MKTKSPFTRSALLAVLVALAACLPGQPSARAADHARYGMFFHGMLEREVYLPPSGYEGWFLGTAHGDAEAERVVEAGADVISRW